MPHTPITIRPLRNQSVRAICLAPAGPPRARLLSWENHAVAAIPGRYCMSYIIIRGNTAALIDVGSTADVPLIRQTLRELAVERVSFAMPTHLHFDHAMGIDAAAQAFDAPVLLGSESHRRVTSRRPVPWPGGWGPLLAIPGWFMQGMPAMPSSDRRLRFRFGFPWSRNAFHARIAPVPADGEPPGFAGWRVVDTPGHSPDSVCFYHAEAGVLIAGDCVRNYRGGEWNGLLDDPEAYGRTREMLCKLSVQAVCPGHGSVLFGQNCWGHLREPTLLPW